MLRKLLQAAMFVAAERRVDCAKICAHPKHARNYQCSLGFREIGEMQRCPLVCLQPAVDMSLMLSASNSATAQSGEEIGLPLSGPSRCELHTAPLDCRQYFQRLLDEVSPLPRMARREAAA